MCGCYEESDKELDEMHGKIEFLISCYTKQVKQEQNKRQLELTLTLIK